MRTNLKLIQSFLLITTLMAVVATRSADGPPYSIIQQPEDLTREMGTYVAFSVRAAPEAGAMYQWYRTTEVTNTEMIGINSREYVVESPNVNDVGAYWVTVTWPSIASVTSTKVFLSAYEVHGTNSTVGTLTMPTSLFTAPAPGGVFACSGYTNIFDKYYTPGDSTDAPYFFFGRNVPTNSQAGPFINWGHDPYLRIQTAGVNGALSTGIRLSKSFDPPAAQPPPWEVACDAGDGVTGPTTDYYSMSTSSDPKLARYIISIYYHTPAPSNGKVAFNFWYRN